MKLGGTVATVAMARSHSEMTLRKHYLCLCMKVEAAMFWKILLGKVQA